MHILVSFCNLRAPGVPALGLLDATSLEFKVLDLPAELAQYTGFTGLALSECFVYVAAQPPDRTLNSAASPSSMLLIFDRRNFALLGDYAFRSRFNIHSLWACKDCLYAVSTGTDEVMELRLRDAQAVSERCLWRPDPDGPRRDVHHLNGIYKRNDDIFVSGFGKKVAEQWTSARNGFITNISRGEILISDIRQPHSVTEIGCGLAYCESSKMAVRVIGDSRVQYLAGYTRGLCAVGDRLFVGTSMGRQVSKSTGMINNPAEAGPMVGRCTISRLSIATFALDQIVDLGVHTQEIYDLLPIEDVRGWPIATEIAWRDASIRELARALDERTRWAKQSVQTVETRDATIRELQSQISRNADLQREVAKLHEVLVRQSSNVDSGRRVVDAEVAESVVDSTQESPL